jgi:hypothetical protein
MILSRSNRNNKPVIRGEESVRKCDFGVAQAMQALGQPESPAATELLAQLQYRLGAPEESVRLYERLVQRQQVRAATCCVRSCSECARV